MGLSAAGMCETAAFMTSPANNAIAEIDITIQDHKISGLDTFERDSNRMGVLFNHDLFFRNFNAKNKEKLNSEPRQMASVLKPIKGFNSRKSHSKLTFSIYRNFLQENKRKI
jgi:hypothetical protein